MTRQLHIARELYLPLDAVTQKIAILGTSGSGKSYCMTKLAEQMLDAKAQVVIVDPKAEAWGLRLKADGKSPAYDIPVLGGEHGDAPLRPDMGARVAELIVANDYSCVLDVSEFIPQEWAQFCYEFATRLLQLKKQKKSAMCLMIDEAHDFIPQNPDEKGWVPKMLGAMQRLQKLGRALGIGMALASQRPQEVSKKALNLCELWITFQLIGTHERDSTVKTVGERDRETAAELDGLLPTLEIGHAYIWSPRWLKVKGVYHVLQKTTFDSSATPEVGAKPVEPRKLARAHLEALREDLQDVIAEAEANDPERLKREKAELARELAGVRRELERAGKSAPPAEVRQVEVAVVKPAELRRIEALVKRLEDSAARVESVGQSVSAEIAKFEAARAAVAGEALQLRQALGRTTREPTAVPQPATAPRRTPPPAPVRRAAPPPSDGDLQLSSSQQRVLDAIAFYEAIGNPEPTNVQVGAVALMDATGGHFSNVVGPLSSGGLIVRAGGRMRLTDPGRARARAPDYEPTLAAYHRVLRERVRKMKSASGRTVDVLDCIIRGGGREVSNEEIGQALGIDHTGGHFSNVIGPLSTLGLIKRRDGVNRPTEILFPEGLR